MITMFDSFGDASLGLMFADAGDILVYPVSKSRRWWWPFGRMKKRAFVVTSRSPNYIVFREIAWE